MASFNSSNMTSPRTPSKQYQQAEKPPIPKSTFSDWSSTDSKEARKEQKKAAKRERKEAKQQAKKLAHEEAKEKGPNVGGLIFDPAVSASTTKSPVAKETASSTRPANTIGEGIPQSKQDWSLDRIMQYIIDYNICLSAEDKTKARACIADRSSLAAFLTKVESEITAEEVAEAEALVGRVDSPVLRPLDWSRDDFMGVIGLGKKEKEGMAPKVYNNDGDVVAPLRTSGLQNTMEGTCS